MKIIGVIPARYASSRFAGKPLADICGKPMIWWVYQQALKVHEIDELYVATDDERIKDVCVQYNMQYMMTSESHQTAADRIAEVALRTDGDIYLNIQGDEPLIEPEAIKNIIALKISSKEPYVGLKSSMENAEAINDPNTVKAVTDLEGYALYFSRSPIPYTRDVKCVYRCMGLYAYDREMLIDFQKWGQSGLEIAEKGIEMLRATEHGIKVKLFDTEWHSIGVDLPEHIPLVEEIMKGKINGK